MHSRVTVKDIAREVGVHYATVSRALRDDPRVAAATASSIKQAATKLGYEPDPMMRALAAYRANVKPVSYKETIGFLWPEQTRREIAASPYLRRYADGAKSRGATLGYQVEEFFLAESSAQALRRVLQARGIRGLVIGSFNRVSVAHLSFAFERLALAAISTALKRPLLHRVGHDHFGGMRLALHQLKRLGYRRIAFLVADVQDRVLERRYSSAFLAHHPLGAAQADDFLRVVPTPDETAARKLATASRADAVLMTFSPSPSTLGVPRRGQVPLVSLDVLGDDGRHAGISQQLDLAAASAIDIVVEQIIHGCWGVPKERKNVLTDGVWVDHPSCPAR